ncbi:MAG: potassium channel protein [Deltaproteobacteria bacterium]|nr:MAG: potassium channel protein [Deltaproteobacteria bacterium]
MAKNAGVSADSLRCTVPEHPYARLNGLICVDSVKHLSVGIIFTLVVVATGTIGYVFLEGWGVLDAVYMTIITLTTVGFGEVHQVSTAGRVFTIFLIIVGWGAVVYVAGTAVQFMVEGRIREILGRRNLDKKIARMGEHCIVCGYGRIGQVVCRYLEEHGQAMVVVEKNPELIPVMEQDKRLYLSGDASDEGILRKAGIERARYLIAALATDTDNVFLVLTARQLSAVIFIMARAGSESAKVKLIAAGADKVESPYEVGALQMSMGLMRPTIKSFLDLALARSHTDIQMDEFPVGKNSSLVNVMLKDSGIRQQYNLIIIALKKMDGSMHFNPSFETRLRAGDTVIAVGSMENLQRLEMVLKSKDGSPPAPGGAAV